MRWPWMSRRAHEVELARYQAAAARAAELLDALLVRYDTLLDKYHALRVVGATIPEPKAPTPTRQPDPLEPFITTAHPTLRALALRQLRQDRAAGMTDEEIMQRMREGVTTRDEDADSAD